VAKLGESPAQAGDLEQEMRQKVKQGGKREPFLRSKDGRSGFFS